MNSDAIYWITLGGAVTTYLARVGGHLVLSRFPRIHPRVEAALDAVPAAVLVTLVAPEVAQGGPAGLASLAVTALVSCASVCCRHSWPAVPMIVVRGRWDFEGSDVIYSASVAKAASLRFAVEMTADHVSRTLA